VRDVGDGEVEFIPASCSLFHLLAETIDPLPDLTALLNQMVGLFSRFLFLNKKLGQFILPRSKFLQVLELLPFLQGGFPELIQESSERTAGFDPFFDLGEIFVFADEFEV
jgi:hypothetical protein